MEDVEPRRVGKTEVEQQDVGLLVVAEAKRVRRAGRRRARSGPPAGGRTAARASADVVLTDDHRRARARRSGASRSAPPAGSSSTAWARRSNTTRRGGTRRRSATGRQAKSRNTRSRREPHPEGVDAAAPGNQQPGPRGARGRGGPGRAAWTSASKPPGRGGPRAPSWAVRRAVGPGPSFARRRSRHLQPRPPEARPRKVEPEPASRTYHGRVATLPKLDPGAVAETGARLRANIQRAVKVRDEVVRDVLVALLAEGHVLIEDYPGVGKTALARALARSLDAEYARVQCTVDLLPADVIGTNVFNQREARFEFHPGPVFANVVLVDEVNRTSPKTQSGPAGVHAGAACDGRRPGARAGAAVPGHRDPEPDRVRGDLSPSRGSARPVHGASSRSATRRPTRRPRCSPPTRRTTW